MPDEELVGVTPHSTWSMSRRARIYVERATSDDGLPSRSSEQASRKSAHQRRSHQYRSYVRNTMAVDKNHSVSRPLSTSIVMPVRRTADAETARRCSASSSSMRNATIFRALAGSG